MDKKQNNLPSEHLLKGEIETISDIPLDADLTTLISSFNDLLVKLRTRGVIN